MEKTIARRFDLVNGDDRMEVTIFSDGTVKQEITGSISATNHATADKAVKAIAESMGGKTEWKKKHGHEHGHTHAHGGHTHKH